MSIGSQAKYQPRAVIKPALNGLPEPYLPKSFSKVNFTNQSYDLISNSSVEKFPSATKDVAAGKPYIDYSVSKTRHEQRLHNPKFR